MLRVVRERAVAEVLCVFARDARLRGFLSRREVWIESASTQILFNHFLGQNRWKQVGDHADSPRVRAATVVGKQERGWWRALFVTGAKGTFHPGGQRQFRFNNFGRPFAASGSKNYPATAQCVATTLAGASDLRAEWSRFGRLFCV